METEERTNLEKKLVVILKKIEEFDTLIDEFNKQFAEKVQIICNEQSSEEKQKTKIEKLSKEYGKHTSKLLISRDELFEAGLEVQHLLEQTPKEIVEEHHLGKLDENGRPIGYIRVHGKWKKRRPRQ